MRGGDAHAGAPREPQQSGGQKEQDAEDRKGIRIGHDHGLPAHDVAERHDGLALGGGGRAGCPRGASQEQEAFLSHDINYITEYI
jgi:hypothetical protein